MRRFEIDRVRKAYAGGVLANNDISLDIEVGEIFGLLGPNGAGKSTLVRQMVALLHPDAGRITYDGRPVARGDLWLKRSIAYLSQRPLALFDLTAREAIVYTGQLRGLPEARARAEADSLLDQLGLAAVADRIVATLSGGQHRLVAVGSALVGDAETLVLDEPTNELDPQMRRVVWDALKERCRSRGATVILVTHNALEAEGVLQRLAVLVDGSVVVCGTPGQIKSTVDGDVRVELTFREAPNGTVLRFEGLGKLSQTAPNRLTVSAPRDQARALLDRVLSIVALDDLDDFRVLTPTLEDVYLRVAHDKVSS